MASVLTNQLNAGTGTVANLPNHKITFYGNVLRLDDCSYVKLMSSKLDSIQFSGTHMCINTFKLTKFTSEITTDNL